MLTYVVSYKRVFLAYPITSNLTIDSFYFQSCRKCICWKWSFSRIERRRSVMMTNFTIFFFCFFDREHRCVCLAVMHFFNILFPIIYWDDLNAVCSKELLYKVVNWDYIFYKINQKRTNYHFHRIITDFIFWTQ